MDDETAYENRPFQPRNQAVHDINLASLMYEALSVHAQIVARGDVMTEDEMRDALAYAQMLDAIIERIETEEEETRGQH